jgi:hypothetical protein
MSEKMTAETAHEGRVICIMQGESKFMLLDRDEAMELIELLPSLIGEMPVNIETEPPK